MRRVTRCLVPVMAASILFAGTVTPASAKTLDHFCSETGDYCTLVIEKASGTIIFKIRGFADYFGRAKACVTKDTEVCRRRSAKYDGTLYEWKIAWQGNYPNQGAGRYTMRWYSEGGGRIGTALHFER